MDAVAADVGRCENIIRKRALEGPKQVAVGRISREGRMHAAIRADGGLAIPALNLEYIAAIETHGPQMVVRGEVKLLSTAIRAEKDFGVVNYPPDVHFRSLPAQGARRGQGKHAHAFGGDGINISIRSH